MTVGAGRAPSPDELALLGPDVGEDVVVRACPGGPLLVRGARTVRGEDGAEHAVTRPVVAVCACGKSSRKPWCDSTHKAIPEK